jgi:hypothetical protein
LNVVVGSTTHLFRWKEEKISFASLLPQSEELTKASNATTSNPTLIDRAKQEEGMGSPRTLDSSQLSQGQRLMGRKHAKKHLENKGRDEGSYKNAIQQLLTEEEETKLKDLRLQEAKTINERRLSVEER